MDIWVVGKILIIVFLVEGRITFVLIDFEYKVRIISYVVDSKNDLFCFLYFVILLY